MKDESQSVKHEPLSHQDSNVLHNRIPSDTINSDAAKLENSSDASSTAPHKIASSKTPTLEHFEPSKGTNFETGPIERLHLFEVLKDVTSRLATIETTFSKQDKQEEKPASHLFLEVCRIIFSGWPAFGFLFLLLFYSPLHDALASIPDKVKSADEIQLAGVSLKSTIKRVAVTQGLPNLGETIPNLSSPAIEFLLRAPRRGGSLVSYTNADDRQHFSAINFPSDRVIKTLVELQEKGLIKLEGGILKDSEPLKPLDGAKLTQMSNEFKLQLHGSTQSLPGDDEINWKLDTPILPDEKPLPRLWVTLTDAGAQAVDLILKAVSTALISAPDQSSK